MTFDAKNTIWAFPDKSREGEIVGIGNYQAQEQSNTTLQKRAQCGRVKKGTGKRTFGKI